MPPLLQNNYRRLSQETEYNILAALLCAKEFRPEDSIVLCSESRGGGTWLMEILHKIAGTVVNWEPLHVRKGVVPAPFHWGWRPCIPRYENNPAFLGLMAEMLTFKISSPWTLAYCSLKRALTAQRVITKFARGNLLLPWLTANFTFRHKPVYLLRHPVATALSQIKSFQNAAAPLAPFQVPDCIGNERFITHHQFIDSRETRLERQVALWCVNNEAVINSPDHDKKWIAIHYEDLVLDPQQAVSRLLEALGLPPHSIAPGTARYRTPSASDFRHDFISDPARQLAKWKDRLDERMQERIQHIFDHFNIRLYSAFNILPEKEAGPVARPNRSLAP